MTDTLACKIDPAAPGHTMSCMEVWGGNQGVDTGVKMAGLDAWIYSRPYGKATAGGDVYYVSSCATGRITRLLVADVSGHGSVVDELAIGLRTLMRRYVNYIDQSRFVQAMNVQFSGLGQMGNFATAVVTTFFAPTNRLSLCNAGHPPPLIYRAGEGRWSFLEQGVPEDDGAASATPSNLPLGVIDMSDYEQFEVDLRLGDLVLCYTDSLPESYDRNGEMLGQDGLLRVVNDVEVGEPTTFVCRLLNHISELREGNLDGDDVTALLFRPNGSAPTKPFKDRLLAPFRVARAILGSIGRKDAPAPWPELSVANLGGAMIVPLSKVGQKPAGETAEQNQHANA